MTSLKQVHAYFDQYYARDYQLEIACGDSIEEAPKKVGTSLQHKSLLAAVTRAALWPLRISQFAGFFPISIQRQKNGVNSSSSVEVSVDLLATASILTSPSAWWTLLLISLAAFPIISFQADAQRFDDYSGAFESMGRNTFRVINTLWIVFGNGCPFLTRIDAILQRTKFRQFWTNFLEMLRQFDAELLSGAELSSKFGASLRRKFLGHAVINFSAFSVGLYGGLSFAVNYEGETYIYIMGILQDGFLMMLACFQVFGFTLMIFFLLVYNHCLGVILTKLEQGQNSNDVISKLIKLYKLVDDQVHQFNAVFNYKIVLEVFYNFMSILFYGYFLILFTKMQEIMYTLTNVASSLILMAWFVWLGKQGSEITEKSKEIGRKLAYVEQNVVHFVPVQKAGACDQNTNYNCYKKWNTLDCKIRLTTVSYIQSCPLTVQNSIFDLNLRMLLSIIAAISTYLVIIVQFQSVDRS
ncbi:uncharacterized protein LOC118433128 [Folsomia candida]|uniref:Gustatory receptor n=1 Tax=Folsomia candida TaxID=158441 RepID=A0A226D258_FOLCA|nr:uncharacterized protein LOC118433128 [Folsomia candida]OXA38954.1 hypothetical protein Fcan01_26314 [Folsomia candida]